MSERIVQEFLPGKATGTPLNTAYRLGKLERMGLLKGKWLDFGCASGSYTIAMLRFGVDSAVGVDVIKDRIDQAEERWGGDPRVKFVHIPAATLPFPDGTFNGVLMNEVMEHVSDEAQTLRELYRVLRPGGTLIVISPNRYFPFEGHGGRIGGYVLHFPVPFLPWLPKKIGQRFMRARNYWPRELSELVATEGFSIRATDFVWPVLEVYRWLPASVI